MAKIKVLTEEDEPTTYTISVRKEKHGGEMLYVGRVNEFPYLTSFEDSHDEALALVFDAIQTSRQLQDTDPEVRFGPNALALEPEEDEPKSIIELGLEYGLTDEEIEEQLVTSVAVYGLMILEEEYDNDGEGMAFTLKDDIGDIEVVVRRVPPGGTHANTVSNQRVLH